MSNNNPKSILIVEDSHTIREMLKESLFQEGYEVVTSKSAEDACPKHPFSADIANLAKKIRRMIYDL